VLHALVLLLASWTSDLATIARPPAPDDVSGWSLGPPREIPECERWLAEAGVTFTVASIPLHENRARTLTCGAPQVVRYKKGPTGIRIKGSPPVTCALALALSRFEPIVQEEAQRVFGEKVVRIEHIGTYNCREMADYPGWVSEHSYANGIDIRRFVLENGRVVDVLGHYGDGASATTDADTRFLRAVATRAFTENAFSVVLTPAFDRLHRNHLHLDMAPYRVDGTRATE